MTEVLITITNPYPTDEMTFIVGGEKFIAEITNDVSFNKFETEYQYFLPERFLNQPGSIVVNMGKHFRPFTHEMKTIKDIKLVVLRIEKEYWTEMPAGTTMPGIDHPRYDELKKKS